MKKEKKEKNFVHKPVYPGGIKAIRQLIRENLQYPEAARGAGIEGTVYLKYAINYQGGVSDVKVVSGLGYGCDEEAIRLVSLLKFEVPKNRKIKVLFHKTIQIHFRLPASAQKPVEPAAAPTQIQYHYVAKEKEEKTQGSDGKKDGYSYTINW
jgi:protein TonB